MKVCNVTMHYYPIVGGQEVYIDNLNRVLEKNDFETSVLQRRAVPKSSENTKIYSVLPIPRYLFFYPFLANADWFAFNLSLCFSRKLLASQDILISHYPFHYPPISWHKKVIIVSHGVLWSEKSKNVFDIYHKKISLGLKNKNVFIVANDTHFLREIGYDVPPNKSFFSEVQRNIWFIPNCVDTELFTRRKNIKKEKIILVPRNIRYDRGIHLAIEAFKIFADSRPDYKMLIVGRGRGKYYDYCRGLIAKFNLDNKVIFAGHASQEEMIDYYNRSAVTLIPSLEKEGTSLSALESMSCGTATVVTAVAGLLDLPALKTSLSASDISDTLNYAIDHNSEISDSQQKIVRANFNIWLWEKAWLGVINSVKNR